MGQRQSRTYWKQGRTFIADILEYVFQKWFNTLKSYKSIRVMLAFKYGIEQLRKFGENSNIKYIYRKVLHPASLKDIDGLKR